MIFRDFKEIAFALDRLDEKGMELCFRGFGLTFWLGFAITTTLSLIFGSALVLTTYGCWLFITQGRWGWLAAFAILAAFSAFSFWKCYGVSWQMARAIGYTIKLRISNDGAFSIDASRRGNQQTHRGRVVELGPLRISRLVRNRHGTEVYMAYFTPTDNTLPQLSIGAFSTLEEAKKFGSRVHRLLGLSVDVQIA